MQAACNKDTKCQGFKHVAGTTRCVLLSPSKTSTGKVAKKGKKSSKEKNAQTAAAKAEQLTKKYVKSADKAVSPIKKHRDAIKLARAAGRKKT